MESPYISTMVMGKGDKSAEHAGIWETGIINLIND